MQMIRVYAEFAQTQAAMPVIPGRKSRVESFAGANVTYTIEAMMGDKKALQAGTSHNLGDNFAKAFDTTFLDDKGETQYVHQSSWGNEGRADSHRSRSEGCREGCVRRRSSRCSGQGG
jgi:prolyl-tRNA synthetase